MLTLYIHIPFCVQKCPYCDFYSETGFPVSPRRYIEGLLRELAGLGEIYADRRWGSIFIGGGTPSLMEGQWIEALLAGINALKAWGTDCEITLEANPESCTERKLEAWSRAGVNRLSLGVQAFDDARLAWLRRPHDAATARKVLSWLRDWPGRVSVDLIYATPGHDPAAWRKELDEVVDSGIGHISCYALTLEPGTPLHRQGVALPDEEQGAVLFECTREHLTGCGLPPYEISNFARPGEACRHNLHGWEYGDYLGIGAGAHGKWTLPDGSIWHTENPRHLDRYFTSLKELRRQRLTPEEAGRECLLMGLRLTKGVNRATYRCITGRDLVESRGAVVNGLVEGGFLLLDAERVRLTGRGILLADEVILAILD
ncbi:MAG: radical SAM family heme chaperone HemW [Magnetococcales bacterium]|nr:radical SAM family heme chaperone HemW [Magnetococcales bacterium]